jgi:hypothetical protein
MIMKIANMMDIGEDDGDDGWAESDDEAAV